MVFQYFLKLAPREANQKLCKYKCKFCNKQYALHASRMAKHLIECSTCPKNVKAAIKKDIKLVSPLSPRSREKANPSTSTEGTSLCLTTSSCSNSSTSLGDFTSQFRNRNTSSALGSTFRMDSFYDTITDEQQSGIWKYLAKAIFATGTPISITENKYWIEAFKFIRPSLKLPSRYLLSNTLLNQVYEDVEISVGELVANATFIGVQCDAWTNVRNESIINFILTTPKPVFYKTLCTEEDKHTSEYISNKLAEIYEEVGLQRIVACVTDNARNMTKTWELLTNKYPSLFISYYGCASHVLNLLTNDLLKLKSVSTVVNSSKSIVNSIKNKIVLSAAFRRIQKEKLAPVQRKSLKLPVVTRWASIITCLECLKQNKSVLQTLAISDENQDLDKHDRANILDNDIFWLKVEKFLILFEPIKKWIVKLQSDYPCPCTMSEVVEAFHEIEVHFEKEVPTSPLLINEESYAIDAVKKRKTMCLKAIHYAANILDPRYKGKNINSSDWNTGLDYIYKLASNFNAEIQIDELFKNIAEYRSGDGFFALKFVKSSQKNPQLTPLNFWKGICTDLPLSKVAEAVLTMPPTSAATERSFSSQGFIHNKKRNRLTTERAAKLTYIHHNLNLLSNDASRSLKTQVIEHKATNDKEDSDSEVEVLSEESEAEEDGDDIHIELDNEELELTN